MSAETTFAPDPFGPLDASDYREGDFVVLPPDEGANPDPTFDRPDSFYEDMAPGAEQPADGFEDSDAAFARREEERARERAALFSRLNERQTDAVSLPRDASCLVLAGAGSGKTSVLTARIARLVDTGVPARAILAVTFTNKAAEEMRGRLRKLMDKKTVNDLMVGTFHSLCNKILRDNAEAAGLPKAFAILDTDGQEAVCRGILKDLGLTKASVKAAQKARSAAASLNLLSGAEGAGVFSADVAASLDAAEDDSANEFVSPSKCAKYISSRKEAGLPPSPPMNVTTQSTDVEQMEMVYSLYQLECAKSGLLDFQDLLTRTVSLLETNSDVRNSYRDRLSSILVDEFQDTNDIQYRWLELIKGSKSHVMAVGDDYQSIYAFRGANPKNMFRFLADMATDDDCPEGRIIKLEQNYRSLPHILDAANAVIALNTNQMSKTLFTSQPDRGEKIELITYANGLFEARNIAREIHKLAKNEKVQPSEMAVLYRTNQQSRVIEQELNKLGVPLTVYGGFRFYERQEVKFVLAYLDLVTDMTRDVSFARVANFPPRGLGDRTIEELRQGSRAQGISMMEMIGERSVMMAENPTKIGGAAAQKKQRALEDFAAVIVECAEKATTEPLHKLVEFLIARSGLVAHYEAEATGSKSSQTESEERVANISELISAARQFELDNPELDTAAEQLPEYMAHVALMTSTSESDMSRKNTVSLMTVHSSKGLEFDHVFIAGLEENIFPHSRAINEDQENGAGMTLEDYEGDFSKAPGAGTNAENADGVNGTGGAGAVDVAISGCLDVRPPDGDAIQEERRLMYVALTRARKSLTLSHANERLINGESSPSEPSRFLEEIPRNRLRLIDDSERYKEAKASSGNHEYGGDAFDAGRDPLPRKPFFSKVSDAAKQKISGSSSAPSPHLVQATKSSTTETQVPGRNVAIIGTAGRDKNVPLTSSLWDAMLADARARVTQQDTLVSGGAAWADHLAVALFLEGRVKALTLHLPAPLDEVGFLGDERNSAGSAANYYHGLFQRITGVNGLTDIHAAIKKGAVITAEPAATGYGAMFTRNKKVAAGANAVLAYTFGDGDAPKDGGTQDTWNQCNASSKVHVPLTVLANAPVLPRVVTASSARTAPPPARPALRANPTNPLPSRPGFASRQAARTVETKIAAPPSAESRARLSCIFKR